MSDYCSESEALAEREDDNCEYAYDPWEYDDYKPSYRRIPSIYVGRKSKLGHKIENRKTHAENTKVGDKCRCPICKKFFEKKTYQQKFCSDKCRIRYHNKRKVYV